MHNDIASNHAKLSQLVEQARLIVANARAALDAAGASPENLVMVRVYMVDLTPERLDALMPSLLELFDGSRPSVTGVDVVALAAPDLQLEVEMIARLPQ
ncbi:MAG: Rid family hydrolase [Pseudomonadota bacterium]